MSRLRETARFARTVPIVRDVIAASDPRRRAKRLAQSGIIDTDLYAAQLGVPNISAVEAAEHYCTQGFRDGYTVNVLLDPYVIRRNLIRTDRPVIYDYLNSAAWHARTSGVWSVVRYLDENPEALEHPAGPVGHLWDRVTANPTTKVEIQPGGVRELSWREVYPTLFDATVEWVSARKDRLERYPRSVLEHPPRLVRQDGPTPAETRVSIVMPVWNRPAGLRRAVESVRAQTWSDWELIIVDDGSWDDTVAIAELLAAHDGRISVILSEHRGVCAARNDGIGAATGELVAFLDSDNTWEPGFLEDVVYAMSASSAEAAYATIAIVDESGTRYRYGVPRFDSLIRGNSIDLNTLVVRAPVLKAIGGFDESLRRAVDYDLILRLARRQDLLHVPMVGAVYSNASDATDRISTSEAFGWNTLVRLRHQTAAEPELGAAGSSVIQLLQRHDPFLPSKLLEAAALTEADPGAHITLAAIDLKPDEWRQVRVAALGRTALSTEHYGADETYAYVVNSAAARASRPMLVVIDPRSMARADQVAELLESATQSDTAMIPLTSALDGTIESCGTAFAGPQRHPVPILRGHPVEDAAAVGRHVDVPAMSGRTFAVPTRAFRTAGGLDPLLYNEHELAGLSLRLKEAEAVSSQVDLTIVVPQTVEAESFETLDDKGTASTIRALSAGAPVTDLEPYYSPAGLHVSHWRRAAPSDVDEDSAGAPPQRLVVSPIVVRDRPSRASAGDYPRLRWSLKTAAPAGPRGESWGDTHFARSLAAALSRLGQDAVVDAREARARETEHLDDVTVVLRGLDDITTPPGSLAYLWVISHPDMVTPTELRRFDRVFAASFTWAERTSRRWNIDVQTLLQCTDPSRFVPTGAPRGDSALFVGNSRGIPRPTVMEAVKAGVPLRLYGGDWERFLPAEAVTAPSIDNAELGTLYESAALVLNDHWSDMQREGFISNRLFDVVAAGGRVLSDRVDGIDEIFEGAVQTYSRVGEIAPMMHTPPNALFPSDSEIARISEVIRTQHSFDARARVLLTAALRDLGMEDLAR